MEDVFVVKTLKELVENRRELIEAHRKNDFTDGIHALLTDLYPDSAHFIYELLQNAEDMNATTVRFFLTENGIDFEHNGTKRMFTVSDIDAITNIGHNGQKKDDPTSIGKFGVGFKAVFAYTATPEIHSGEYHFRIRDYFVPEFDGVPNVQTCDEFGVQWTKFSLPFNNAKKSPIIAYRETLKGLDALDENSILFLQHIQKIEYMLQDGSIGTVERHEKSDHRVLISCKRPQCKGEYNTQWLKFYRPVEIIDDQGYRKTLSIAIAYAMEQNKKTGQWRLIPVQGGGKTFIYFPAEKEYSGLQFHINAPFASTVARDSVRNCEDNYKLLKQISKLVVESIAEVKRMNFLNHSFFEVLPNEKDELSVFYQTVFDYIYQAFHENEYLPTREKEYVSVPNALMGPATIANLFNNSLKELLGINGNWIANASQRNSRADNFIRSLDIREVTYSDFRKLFSAENREKTENFLEQQNNDWMKKFYLLCATVYKDGLYYSDNLQYGYDMRKTRMIRSTKEKMFVSSQIYILPPNTELVTKTTNIVSQFFLLSEAKDDKSGGEIYDFFTEDLGIKVYGPKVEIEAALENFEENEVEVDAEYFDTMIAFAKYENQYDDVDFLDKKIFLVEKDDGLYFTTADRLFLGIVYNNPDGEVLARAYEKGCLWNGYKEHYNEKQLQRFLTFVRHCGINEGLKIEKVSAYNNPLYYKYLYSEARNTGYGDNSDYTIVDLKKLLDKERLEINKIIWNTLRRQGRWASYMCTASYAPNASAVTKRCDSTLIYWLKNSKWIADRKGNLCQPKDLELADLGEGFEFDSDSDLLAALEIGSAKVEMSLKRKQLEKEAQAAGGHFVTDEEFQELQELRKLKKAQEATISHVSLPVPEMLKRQKKEKISGVNVVQSEQTPLSNVKQKELNIEASFKNAKKMPELRRKLFGKIIDSSKDEKRRLKLWYNGKCQMCGTTIIGYNQVPHFIAKNIINTQMISGSIRQTMELGWNSLCLCPNCAMKYDVCSRDITNLYEQILGRAIKEGEEDKVVLTIELNGTRQSIYYDPEHFLALKKAIQLIDDETKHK
jgi:hypothetical protein